jgi:ABC-type bacteriocin/lantibiotic exporter with double-glycine peptidase domain
VLLNNVQHWRQQHEDDCLIACAQMVLSYLGIERDEEWLWRRLTVGSVTPFPQLSNLADTLGLVIEVHTGGRLEQFGPSIASGLPVIVTVDADDPQYWPYVRHHAVVVVGFDDQHVFVHDPAQPAGPLAVDIGTFLLAWSRRDFQYSVIRLTEEE